jgi:hypothetical protein
MIIKRKLINTVIGILLLSSNSFASTESIENVKKVEQTSVSENNNSELQKIIDDFSLYTAKIPAEVREEVQNYRKKIAEINQEKRNLYKKISQEAQNYLATEQEYKKKISSLKKRSVAN